VRDATALPRKEDTPFKPFDLHEPDKWQGLADSPVLDWDALHEPMRDVKRYEPPPERYREISRTVRLKDGGRKVWRITRALDRSRPMPDQFDSGILDEWWSWASQVKVLEDPYLPPRPPQGIFGYRFALDGPIHVVRLVGDLPAWATLDVKTRDLPVGLHENKLHPGGVSIIFRGLPVADCNGRAPPNQKQEWEKIATRLAEAKWSEGRMCNPVRNVPLPPSPQGPHRVIQPYSRRHWTAKAVKAHKVLLKQTYGGTSLYVCR
jgi:hypothetical protein